jgi:hypothetical protein
VLLTLACSSTPETLSADRYAKWVSSEDREFNKSKEVKNIELKARYLPAEYLAYREYMGSDSIPFDSLLKSYQCGLTFQLTLQADKADKVYGNLQYYGVRGQEDLTERIRFLSFGAENFIHAQHNGETYTPVLTHFEGFDPISNRVSFQVVFIIPEYNCGNAKDSFQNLIISKYT